jgi:formiminotetrahydrofolate cyclodeaminase
VSRFLAALGSARPVPAGGSAAAAATAIAAGLVEKSARLSVTHWIGAANIGKRAAVLREQAALMVETDATAYTDFMEATRAARGLHTAERERIIGPARKRIVEVPLAIVRAAAEVAGLGVQMVEHGNPNLRSDAVTAVHLAAAAAEGAAATIAADVKTAGDERLTEARSLAKDATERARTLRAQGPASGRGRGRVRSEGSARP